jgi:hypothetical protein
MSLGEELLAPRRQGAKKSGFGREILESILTLRLGVLARVS